MVIGAAPERHDPADPVASSGSGSGTGSRTIFPSSRTALALAVTLAVTSVVAAAGGGVAWTTALTVVAMLPAVLVDIRVRRLPDRLVASSGIVFVVAAVAESVAGRHLSPVDAALGAAAMSIPLLASHLVSPASMGFGDVKAAVVVGAALGVVDPFLGLVALAVGSAGAAVIGIVMRRRTVPFGPAIVAGAVVAMVLTCAFGSLR